MDLILLLIFGQVCESIKGAKTVTATKAATALITMLLVKTAADNHSQYLSGGKTSETLFIPASLRKYRVRWPEARKTLCQPEIIITTTTRRAI